MWAVFGLGVTSMQVWECMVHLALEAGVEQVRGASGVHNISALCEWR